MYESTRIHNNATEHQAHGSDTQTRHGPKQQIWFQERGQQQGKRELRRWQEERQEQTRQGKEVRRQLQRISDITT